MGVLCAEENARRSIAVMVIEQKKSDKESFTR